MVLFPSFGHIWTIFIEVVYAIGKMYINTLIELNWLIKIGLLKMNVVATENGIYFIRIKRFVKKSTWQSFSYIIGGVADENNC